ncbi:T9SS type A sorting domain-containing protein [candidate division KSB1 bacterium]|nr:T9SS type A sorting domain-containing protein [candidate division KSB1 bacterium]
MRMFRKRILLFTLILGLSFQGLFAQGIIVDHNHRDITPLTQSRIDDAKSALHIAYGHTSHGSQVTDGMSGLVAFANGGGKGMSYTTNTFAWNNGGTGGALDLHDYAMGGDVGYYPDWVNNTVAYLGAANGDGRGSNNPDVNVIIWSWCGQASSQSEASMISNYLDPMTALEATYYGVTFVYMTGHADGGGLTGNLHIRNQQIRNYCITNNKVLYDFYDIECYNPDGTYFGDQYVTDACGYTGGNWATEWRALHTEGTDWYSCGSAHSDPLNANQKAYAAWWLWVLIAERDISLSVQMSDLYAVSEMEKGITLHWQTASEVDCIGFHVWRSELGVDRFECLTECAIPSCGNSSCGAEYCYTDSDIVPNKNYEYKIEALYMDGEIEKFGPVQVKSACLPENCIIYPNYPNPFNPETSISYVIPESRSVRLTVYDITGREVRILFDGTQSAGNHEAHWDGRDASGRVMPSGIYISRLMTEFQTIQQKMMLMK